MTSDGGRRIGPAGKLSLVKVIVGACEDAAFYFAAHLGDLARDTFQKGQYATGLAQ